jgi:hypothetical protein
LQHHQHGEHSIGAAGIIVPLMIKQLSGARRALRGKAIEGCKLDHRHGASPVPGRQWPPSNEQPKTGVLVSGARWVSIQDAKAARPALAPS